MRFSIAAAIAGLAAFALAQSPNGTYVTEVVTRFTTFCPQPTQIVHNGETYTVTEATTLTITNCPCTITKPVYWSVATSSTCSTSAPTWTPSAAPYTSKNATAPAYSGPTTGKPTVPSTTYQPAVSTTVRPVPSAAYTGAADKVHFGVAGLLAAVGLVAAL